MHTGREAIALMAAGTALIFLAASLFFVRRNAEWGKDMLDETVKTMDNTTSDTLQGSFNTFVKSPQTVPASAIYALIGYNEDAVDDITCYICDPHGDMAASLSQSCLCNHLKGDVKAWASYDETSGQFHVFISNEIPELTRATKRMPYAAVRDLIIVNEHVIGGVKCYDCGITYSPDKACLYTMHEDKDIDVWAEYDSGLYTVYIDPIS